MIINKNDKIELNIESVTSEGSGLGRYNGIAVFVRGTVPGDRIIAHIIKVSKNYAVGIIDEIVEPSLQRIAPDCPVSQKCGGCSFRHMTYEEELKYKLGRVQDAIGRIGHIDFPVERIIGADSTDFYRNKAQYPVCVENGELTAGFYAYKSHRIIPCRDCRLQPPEFEKGIAAFEKWVKKNNVTSFDEKTGKGLLRHIYFRKAFGTGEIMACAVINGNDIPDREYLVDKLQQAFDNLKSVVININKKNTNVILGDQTKTVWGSDKICDILLDKKFVISPQSFYQVNHDQCEKLYGIVSKYADLSGKETVVDLYCGAGTIGLTLADKCKELVGIEIEPSAIENARENAELNGIKNASFICADAFDGAKEIERRGLKPDMVIVDPPRKGCQKELFDIIENMGAGRIIYVSCDSATLARDMAVLNEKNYKPQHITAVDMFPRTPHVETVVLLKKVCM
ncbi:MAG: 23S rRNA (uracil(1939)-C(5))-methyltransferase RlmD [Eubacterium sp.]|nr:23S rRNA (uracil(1939)-C(5))-methyltransferase RlmD [Eubacterium sp.]